MGVARIAGPRTRPSETEIVVAGMLRKSLVLLGLLLVVVGCGRIDPHAVVDPNALHTMPVDPASPPGPTTPAPGSGQSVTVEVTSYTEDGQLITNVGFGFGRADCAGCSPVTGRTDASGHGRISLPAGSYAAACLPQGLKVACSVVGADTDGLITFRSPTATVTLRVAVNSADLDPSVTASSDDSDGGGGETTGDGDGGGGGNPGADAPDLSGHVTDGSGRPVAGVTIELIHVVSGNDHTTTDANGYYAFDNVTVVSTAVCVTDQDCEPVGVSSPVTVDSGKAMVVNWVVG